nr:hypothetical protein [Streptomyces canus]
MCLPDNGRRRASARPVVPVLKRESVAFRRVEAGLPVQRSPYGLFAPLDGRAAASVRPYVLAAEGAYQVGERERATQARCRMALILAADFAIDLDRHVVDAKEVA